MKGEISITGARENNLKNIDIKIPWHKYTVITGLSGSGKSSLALDTLYAEGLRRYIECLSTYARQFLERVDRPELDDISGLPPAVAIESVNTVRNSRSTVGTTTEIYDYLRLLFAKIGKTVCPECGTEIRRLSPEDIANALIERYEGKRAYITFSAGDNPESPKILLSRGFTKILYGQKLVELEDIDEVPEGADIVVDRVVIDREIFSRLVDSIETVLSENMYVNAVILDGDRLGFSRELECYTCGKRFSEPDPQMFSFNSPKGACESCRGFGNILKTDPRLIIPNPELSLSEGAVEPMTKPSHKYWMRRLLSFASENGMDVDSPYSGLTEKQKRMLFQGGPDFKGINGFFDYLESKNYKMHIRVFLSKYRSAFDCDVCGGSRLKEEALWVKAGGRDIHELSLLPVSGLRNFFGELKLPEYEAAIADEILRQIISRLEFMDKVGLDYLTLSRLSRTLSGGEAQRVNLACQLGSALTETLYILDEPSIGLHPRDISRLTKLIGELRDRDNTVVLVEHDFEMIRNADHVIELGPNAGEQGGEVIFQGSVRKLLGNSHSSLTRRYLTGDEYIPVPGKRRKGSGKSLTITDAAENNLKNIDVAIPLRTFTCVTGVSGSGKSSLVNDVLHAALARKFHSEVERVGAYGEIQGAQYLSDVVMLDQNPIGKSLRSNPVTYIKAYDEIRKALAGVWRARSLGFTPSHFSFNVPGGRCETCKGEGRQKIEMYFLADVYVTCEDCDGERFKKDVLSVKYRNKNVNGILDLTVTEAINFFYETPSVGRKLKILQDVGLGYLRLGQPAPTLSGGEAQRIKIARELGRKGGSDVLYILDEPTAGLHAEDVKKLLEVINRLVMAGNTVLVVEHNLDVIKCADHIIDLGPEGGALGGEIVAQGSPEDIAACGNSHTGRYLKPLLKQVR